MVRKPQQSALRRFFRSRLFFLLLVLLAVVVMFGFIRSYYQDYKIEQQVASLEQEVRDLQSKKLESMEILEYVISDAFVEEKARTELNMKEPGENVVVIDNQRTRPVVVEEIQEEGRQIASNPVKWFYYFFNKKKVVEIKSYE